MNITLSVDEQTVARARERLRAVGRSVNEEIREHLRHVAGDDDEALERDLELLRETAGLGDSTGWNWDREGAYEDRMRWPRS